MLRIEISGCSETEYREFKGNLYHLVLSKSCPFENIDTIRDECYRGKECQECIEKYVHYKKPEAWKPKEGENYCYIDVFGRIVSWVWENGKDDNNCYQCGNCFRTYEEAKASELYKAYRR